MMPIWIHDRTARRYVPIPYDKMDTFPDGSKGFYSYDWSKGKLEHPAETYEFVKKYQDYFRYAPGFDKAKWVWLGQKAQKI